MNAFDDGATERPGKSVALAVRWSWKLVTVAGIDLYVHGTFLLLTAFVAFSGFVAGQGLLTVGNIGELLALAAAGRQTAAVVGKVEG